MEPKTGNRPYMGMETSDCIRCNELNELVFQLQERLVEMRESEARVARAVLHVQRHLSGIHSALEDAQTGITGVSPSGDITERS